MRGLYNRDRNLKKMIKWRLWMLLRTLRMTKRHRRN